MATATFTLQEGQEYVLCGQRVVYLGQSPSTGMVRFRSRYGVEDYALHTIREYLRAGLLRNV